MQILTISQVCVMTTLSKATIYRMVKSGNFPPKISLSKGRSGFLEKDIHDWIKSRLLTDG